MSILHVEPVRILLIHSWTKFPWQLCKVDAIFILYMEKQGLVKWLSIQGNETWPTRTTYEKMYKIRACESIAHGLQFIQLLWVCFLRLLCVSGYQRGLLDVSISFEMASKGIGTCKASFVSAVGSWEGWGHVCLSPWSEPGGQCHPDLTASRKMLPWAHAAGLGNLTPSLPQQTPSDVCAPQITPAAQHWRHWWQTRSTWRSLRETQWIWTLPCKQLLPTPTW